MPHEKCLTALGEALHGLKRYQEATAAFEDAVAQHAIVGRLNSADSMTRLGSVAMLDTAEQWVNEVQQTFGTRLEDNFRAEVDTILGKIAAKFGDVRRARRYFEQAIQIDPECHDAATELLACDRK
jgi:tetratricopeptide (TPR) repeat protein